MLLYIGLTEETCYCTKVRQERHVTVHRSHRRDMLLYIGLYIKNRTGMSKKVSHLLLYLEKKCGLALISSNYLLGTAGRSKDAKK
jgi:hypothetical protein